jgi:hypothetical protein
MASVMVALVVWRFGITLWALRPAPRKSFRCSPFASGNGYHIHVPGVHNNTLLLVDALDYGIKAPKTHTNPDK